MSGISLLLALASLQASPDAPDVVLASPVRGVARFARAFNDEVGSDAGCSARLTPWAPLWEGDRLCLEFGDIVCILCPDGSVRSLSESQVVSLAICDSPPTAACREPLFRTSDPLKEGKQRIVSLELLELETALGITLELRGRARGPREAWGRIPVFVSPHCQSTGSQSFPCERWLSEPREILFLEVEGAEEYHFELSGLQDYESVWVESKHIACQPWPSFDDHSVCATPWPRAWFLPDGGRSVQLTMQAKVGNRLRPSGSPALLSRLPDIERQRLLDALNIIGAIVRGVCRALAPMDVPAMGPCFGAARLVAA